MREYSRSGGGAQWRRKAEAQRRKLIAARNHHEEDDYPPPRYKKGFEKDMPPGYRDWLKKILKTKEGIAALARYRKFWGIPYPPEIKEMEIPGPDDQTVILVGMGRTPEVHLADGTRRSHTRKQKKKGRLYQVATDIDGRRLFLLTGRKTGDQNLRLRHVGWAPETHYVPTEDMEAAGTFKRGKYWVHKHSDDGGSWPEVFQDQAGNFHYAPGTYRVEDWIHK